MNTLRVVALTAVFMLCACSESSTTANNNTVLRADAIYHNAKVYTVNDDALWAEAVAILTV